MQNVSAYGVFVVALGIAVASGCAAPDVNGTGFRKGSSTSGGPTDKDPNKATPGDDDDDVAAPVTPSTPDTGDVDTNPGDDKPPVVPPIVDADKDGIADDVDCAPNDALIAGTKLLQDDLTADKGLFTQADGFPASWSYNAGYIQSRLVAAPDQAVFTKDPAVSEAIVELIAASTEIGNLATPNLRQMFITLGTTMAGGTLSAVGCGLEVDGSQTVTQKTSIVRLNGSPGAVTSTPMNRVDRGAVQAKEEFKIKAELKAGVLKCSVIIKNVDVTTATATVGTLKGSIGLYTNQTKALFKTASICKLK